MTDFGVDTYCLDSLRTGRLVSGVRLLGQRCYHRLITPRGALRGGEDDANFGYDISGECGATTTTTQRSVVESRVVQELLKDPEVESATCSIAETRTGADVAWVVTVNVQSAQGPFELVLAVSAVTVQMVGLRSA